ncbi:MAG: arsenite efflux transporter metallochaperone ArsD [Oscillospiraceae bacterium]|nr:arsenite efflux transporter metallochaperone ArsD [Oscillospiraceae bacterium]
MKKMFIYEPALCCETGLCGVSVDPELLRVTTVAKNLKKNGVTLQRYNLNNFPQEFVKNEEINKLLNSAGVDALPATVVDGKIVKTKAYPTNGEIVMWLNIPADYIVEKAADSGSCCSGSSGKSNGKSKCC